MTAYSVVDDYTRNVLIVALAYLAIGLPSQRLPGRCSARRCAARSATRSIARPFNLTMAALLVASIVPVFYEG